MDCCNEFPRTKLTYQMNERANVRTNPASRLGGEAGGIDGDSVRLNRHSEGGGVKVTRGRVERGVESKRITERN